MKKTSRAVAIRLATGVVKRSAEQIATLKVRFTDFYTEERFIVLEMDERYDLILGIKWLIKHES